MRTEFRKVDVSRELRSLIAFDHKVFSPPDWFDPRAWRQYESYWLLLGSRKIGCCAFEKHADFRDDLGQENPAMKGSLYIASTGILPAFQGKGFGSFMKSWQVAYARRHKFRRMVTNTRKRNLAMIGLNKKFGFRVVRTTRGYYFDPTDSTVVMERMLL